MSSYKPLHLVACDKDDLKVISAMMQDCIINASDMVFDKSMRLFAVMGNRFCWEVEDEDTQQRVRVGVHFTDVLKVSYRDVEFGRDQILSLLAMEFVAQEPPGGILRIIFSGRSEIRLTIDALNMVMQDVTPGWSASSRPQHDDEPRNEN